MGKIRSAPDPKRCMMFTSKEHRKKCEKKANLRMRNELLTWGRSNKMTKSFYPCCSIWCLEAD